MLRAPQNPLPCMRDWIAQHIDRPRLAQMNRRRLERRKPAEYTPATADDQRAAKVLQGVTMSPGSFDKRFRNSMCGVDRLTAAQRDLIWRMVYRYRRQVADRSLIEKARTRCAQIAGRV